MSLTSFRGNGRKGLLCGASLPFPAYFPVACSPSLLPHTLFSSHLTFPNFITWITYVSFINRRVAKPLMEPEKGREARKSRLSMHLFQRGWQSHLSGASVSTVPLVLYLAFVVK